MYCANCTNNGMFLLLKIFLKKNLHCAIIVIVKYYI